MNRRSLLPLLVFVAAVAFAAGCGPGRPQTLRGVPVVSTPYPGIPIIRVMIVKEASAAGEVLLKVSGKCDVYRYDTKKHLFGLPRIRPAGIRASGNEIRIGTLVFSAPAVEIVPRRGSYFSVNDTQYDGNVAILTKGGKVNLVNAIDLESYVKGVVTSEIPTTWSTEAQRAQAMVARTYALWKMESPGSPDWDVVSTVGDQVYNGRSRRARKVDKAVNATRGVVLLWKGQLFPTYYHSSSGGYTENAFNVWQTLDIPPLAGREVPYGEKSPHTRWEKVLSGAQIAEALRAKGHKVGQIRDIIAENLTPSGRPTHVRVVHDGGETRVPSNEFRLAVGAGSSGLKSTRFRRYKEGDSFVFVGSGFGHGVGMDQYAARNMAQGGKDSLEILTYFYPGAEIRTAYR